MFIERPSLFGATLEKATERAGSEVVGLEKIFSQFNIPSNGLVLDLCCGIGRHSVLLAEKGYRVVGVDLSPQYITRAKEIAAERNVNEKTEFKVGDMRQIGDTLRDYDQKFNAVLNLYTSIGYYTKETDRDVLSQAFKLTAPSGILVIQIGNRDFLIRHFLARDMSYPSDKLVLLQERKLNLENSRMENVWKYYEKQGNNLIHLDTFEIDHRIYSLHELKKLTEESGWIYQTCYGSFKLESLTTDLIGMILVAKKG